MTGDIQPLKHGMTTDELLAAWKRRLPNTEPTDNQLSCFAIGVEVGRANDAHSTELIVTAERARVLQEALQAIDRQCKGGLAYDLRLDRIARIIKDMSGYTK